jgi:HSP20 family molecular chaperone IbpA
MIFRKFISFKRFILQYPRFLTHLSNSINTKPHQFSFQNYFSQRIHVDSLKDSGFISQKTEFDQDKKNFQIQFEIPSSIPIENLSLEIKSGFLLVKEKSQQIKQFLLPDDIIVDETKASFEYGIMKIHFKRNSPQNESQTFTEHFMKIYKLHFQVLMNFGLTNIELMKKLIKKFNGDIYLIIPEYLKIEFQK